MKEHEALQGIKDAWPEILGYNKTIARKDAVVAATVGGDPFIAFGEYGRGRSAVFTTDCAPHWAPEEFCNWKYYDEIWNGIVGWLTK